MEKSIVVNQFDKPFRFEDQEDAQPTNSTDEKIAKLNPRELLEDMGRIGVVEKIGRERLLKIT